MKRLLTLALCAASLVAAVSCAKDRPKDSTIKAKSYNYFEAVASTASMTADAGIVLLDITSNVPWTLKADEGLAPAVTSGSGNASVEIAVPENSSFDGRSFSYSVSTEAELDVDDPEQWTAFGRTLEFTLTQDGILPKLSVDASELKVSASAVSAVVTLTANVAYTIEIDPDEDLTFSTEDDEDNPFRHYLTFSFPANETEEAVEYRAEIIPTQTDIPGIDPIEIVIRQAALKVFHLDCTDASNFTWASENAFPTRNNKASEAFDFWLSSQTEYVFHGNVYVWNKHLAFTSGSVIQLPNIPGYSLAEMTVTSQYSSQSPNYRLTDGTDVLASVSINKNTSSFPVTLDISAYPQTSTSPNRYLTSSGEGNIKFILTYIGVE